MHSDIEYRIRQKINKPNERKECWATHHVKYIERYIAILDTIAILII